MKFSVFLVFSISTLLVTVQAQRAGPTVQSRGIKGLHHHVHRDLQTTEKSKKDKKDVSDESDDSGDTVSGLLFGECAICTPENKIRPTELTVRYIGGQGVISRYQDEDKATCRDQVFPDRTNITTYGNVYEAAPGTDITFVGDEGEMDAESDFYFATGNVSTCYIHTSCSQPLVAGDQIGPFLIIEGNDCIYSQAPSMAPSEVPSLAPSDTPSTVPTRTPSSVPSVKPSTPPSAAPTVSPSVFPTSTPSIAPSLPPSVAPSLSPTWAPSTTPSLVPSSGPSAVPSMPPSLTPSSAPSLVPSSEPSNSPSYSPSVSPSNSPSAIPSLEPSVAPSWEPSSQPSLTPSAEPSNSPSAIPTECICDATGTYDEEDGTVTIEFDLCHTEPVRYDWIGIYPCDAPTMTADELWWTTTVCKQLTTCGDFDYGYVKDEVYVNQEPVWFTYSCGEPILGGCQATSGTMWPSKGEVTIDPNAGSVSSNGWAFPGGRSLAPGCYKVLMNRDVSVLSPPPYPTICGPWDEAIEFYVPERRRLFSSEISRQKERLASEKSLDIWKDSGSAVRSTFVISFTSVFALFLF